MFFSLCFLLASCTGPTPASKITDISDIRVDIEVHQSLLDPHDKMASVVLYDKNNKEFGNDSISVSINQEKMHYQVAQGPYYSKNYYYHIENVQPENNRYTFEIQLANGKKFSLGTLPVLALSHSDKIIYKSEASLNEDFSIQWADLNEVNRLYISKSLEVEKKQAENIKTFVEAATETVKIGPSGTYGIKKEKLSRPGEKLSSISFQFTAQKSGELNPRLLKGSSSKINGEHEKRVSFK